MNNNKSFQKRLEAFQRNGQRRDVARERLNLIHEQIQQLSEQADRFELAVTLLDVVHYGHIGDLTHFSDELEKVVKVGNSILNESDPEDYDFDL